MWILPKNVRGSWHLRTAQGPNTSAPKTVDDPPYSLGNGAVAANHRLVDDCRGFFVTEYDHNPWTGNLNNQAVFHHGGNPLSKMTIFGWENPLQASKISILSFIFPSNHGFRSFPENLQELYPHYIPTTLRQSTVAGWKIHHFYHGFARSNLHF